MIAKFKASLASHKVALIHKSQYALHLSYLGGVAFEGHGFISIAAAGLFVMVLVGLVSHVEGV